MSNADDRRAGAIILADLALFNKAVALLEDRIETEFIEEFYAIISSWLKHRGWRGRTGGSALHEISIWPAAWEEDERNPYADFSFSKRPGTDSNSYVIADVFGQGETDWGFKFEVDHRFFGGKNKWNKFARALDDIAENLRAAGWVDHGRGVFFLAVKLPDEHLGLAWETEDWSEALAPLTQALDTLRTNQHHFDRIIKRGKPQSVTT